MRYNKIRKMDISNGPGVRVSIFFQGCSFHCKNCFNKETWDFNGGGGEPMHPKNIDNTTKLAKKFKETYPDKTIWAWSGYLFDNYVKDKEVCKYLDVLVDGQFVDELRNPNLKWKGSSNQRVIDIKKSLRKKKIVLYKD